MEKGSCYTSFICLWLILLSQVVLTNIGQLIYSRTELLDLWNCVTIAKPVEWHTQGATMAIQTSLSPCQEVLQKGQHQALCPGSHQITTAVYATLQSSLLVGSWKNCIHMLLLRVSWVLLVGFYGNMVSQPWVFPHTIEIRTGKKKKRGVAGSVFTLKTVGAVILRSQTLLQPWTAVHHLETTLPTRGIYQYICV